MLPHVAPCDRSRTMPPFPIVWCMEFAHNRPKWVQVHEVISERIRTGEYGPGERVPSVIQLQAEFGIATDTGQKVMRALREAGLIETVSGMGSFVVEQ